MGWTEEGEEGAKGRESENREDEGRPLLETDEMKYVGKG